MGFFKRMSLKRKTVLTLILIISLISVTALLLFSKATKDIIHSEYGTYCSDLANTVASSVNVSDVKAVKREVMKVYRSLPESAIMISDQEDEPGYGGYIARYAHIQQTKEFSSIRNSLRKIQDSSHVQCLYITWPDVATGRLIYLVDGAYIDNWPPGSLEELYDSDFRNDGDINSGFDILLGEDDEGGRIVTAAMPIRDSYGQVIAYAGLDYSIEEMLALQRRFVLIVLLILALLAALASFAAIRLVDRSIVKPVNELSAAAAGYTKDVRSSGEGFHRFADLEIRTGDEIEVLADSIKQMEHDMNSHIANLLSARNELDRSKEYAEEMEKKSYIDALTGVRNKRAYESAVDNLNADITQHVARFGIAIVDLNDLKRINDSCGHDHGDQAIKMICRVICDVFDHSPVYRYGGDEFVVLLRNRDLANISELVDEFKSRVAAMRDDTDAEAWERVTAAIGYSVFDPETDSDTQSVFERADKDMYRDKKEAKEASPAGKKDK